MTEEEKIKKAKALYMRNWRKRNKERVKESDNKYWLGVFENGNNNNGVSADAK